MTLFREPLDALFFRTLWGVPGSPEAPQELPEVVLERLGSIPDHPGRAPNLPKSPQQRPRGIWIRFRLDLDNLLVDFVSALRRSALHFRSCSSVNSFLRSCVCPFVCPFCSFVRAFLRSCVCPFVCSFVRLFLRSLLRSSSVCSLLKIIE